MISQIQRVGGCDVVRICPLWKALVTNYSDELALFHCRPRGSGKDIVLDQTNAVKGSGLRPADVRKGLKYQIPTFAALVVLSSQTEDAYRMGRSGSEKLTGESELV